MASITLNSVADRFPVGQSVSAYRAVAWTGNAPAGSPAATATVASSGSVTFSGLDENEGYVAYALVSGAKRFISFRTVLEDLVSAGLPDADPGQALVRSAGDTGWNPSFIGGDTYDAREAGVLGDGSNQTAALLDAITQAGSRTILLPDGDIVLDDVPITTSVRIQGIPAKTVLWLNNRSATNILQSTVVGNSMLRIQGSKATGTVLTADAPATSKTLTLGANAANYAAGDFCILRSNTAWPNTTKAAKTGEIVRIRSVNAGAGTVAVYSAIDFSYTVADAAQLEKLAMIDDVLLKDLIIRGDGVAFSTTHEQFAVWLQYCRRFKVEDVTLERIDGRGITLRSCFDSDIVRPRFFNFTDSGEHGTVALRRYGYGVDLTEACRDVRIHQPFMRGGRHCVTTNAYGLGAVPSEGVPAHCIIYGGEATEMTSACFDNHPEGYAITYVAPYAHHTQGHGIQIRASKSRVINPTVHRWEGVGIQVANQAEDVVIDSPVLRYGKDHQEQYTGSGQVLSPGHGMRLAGLRPVIRNPIIEDTEAEGIRIDSTTTHVRIEGRAIIRRTGQSGVAGEDRAIEIYGVNTSYGHRFGTIEGENCGAIIELAPGAVTYDSEVEDLIIGTGATAGILVPSRPRSDKQTLIREDDFLKDLGHLAWTRGAGATSMVTPVAGRPGINRLDTTATSGTLAYLALGSTATTGVFLPADYFDLTWIFRANNVDSSTMIQIGAFSDASAATSPTDGLYLEKLTTDTNWFLVNRLNNTQTRTDTTVAADTAWRRVRFRRVDASTMGLTFDTATEVEVTSNRPALSLNPAVRIQNSAAASKTIDLDYFKLALTGLVR